jgi:hypothetical protein
MQQQNTNSKRTVGPLHSLYRWQYKSLVTVFIFTNYTSYYADKYAEDMLVLRPFAKLNSYPKVTVYWHRMRRRVVSGTDRCQRFGGTCCIQLPGRRLNFYSEN